MHLSQTIEYALRAVVWLAENPARAQTTHQIAAVCKAPPSYLAKVLQPLIRDGLIRSQRGPGGGFLLNKQPDRISLLEIVESVEPSHRTTCPLGVPGHELALCPLHRVLDAALQACQGVLAGHTVASLAHQGCFGRCHEHHGAAQPDAGTASLVTLNGGS
jgi:Rrf2 family protein